MLTGGCADAVMEISSHGIHQSRVAGLDLSVAAFLNLSRDHLDYHGGMEAYFSEKRKIFNGENGSLPEVAVINGDCPYGSRLLETIPPQVQSLTFGFGERNTFKAKNAVFSEKGSEFLLEAPCGNFVISSPMLGRYNIMNLLASLAIVYAMDRPIGNLIRKQAESRRKKMAQTLRL